MYNLQTAHTPATCHSNMSQGRDTRPDELSQGMGMQAVWATVRRTAGNRVTTGVTACNPCISKVYIAVTALLFNDVTACNRCNRTKIKLYMHAHYTRMYTCATRA